MDKIQKFKLMNKNFTQSILNVCYSINGTRVLDGVSVTSSFFVNSYSKCTKPCVCTKLRNRNTTRALW